MGEKKRRAAARNTTPGALAADAPAAPVGGASLAELLERAQALFLAARFDDSVAIFRAILAREPAQSDAWQGLGLVAQQRGASDDARAHLMRAVQLAPDAFEFRVSLAQHLQQRAELEPAREQWRAACALRPDEAWCHESLGVVEQALGETASASQAYRRAFALEPSAGRALKLATLVSPIIRSRETMHAERAAMADALEQLLVADLPTVEDPVAAGLWTNFYLAFHGEDDRALQSKTASVLRRLCPSLEYVAPHCARTGRRGGKLRIGLISQFFHNHSIGRTSRGLFEQLSLDEFEVSAIFIAPVVDDEYSRGIRQHAARSVVVPQDLRAAREAIQALELDVLFYQDIGMDPFTGLLAHSRLAPVQCVSFGHPDTTGIPTIDWFVSNERYETPESPAHYSEQLYLLHGLGTLAYYDRPTFSARRKSRTDFGLDANAHLYICPQNLFKLHPDMDALIASVLRRDPSGTLLVIAGKHARWDALIRERWSRSMPDVLDRVAALPRMPTHDYVDLIAVCDVMLDTRHFNGMNTSLEAFAVGTPVVTWPARFQRGRHTQAMYAQMGLDDLVCPDAEAYVALALRLGTDAAFRAATSARILARNDALYDDPRVISEFERFFRDACARAGL